MLTSKISRRWLKLTGLLSILLLCVIVGAIYLFSNKSETKATLLLAESLIEENPDSAAMIVKTLDNNHSMSESEEALLALLKVCLHYKIGYEAAPDSLAEIAVEYYSSTTDSLRLAKANYYLAKYYAGGISNLSAVLPASSAYEYFSSTDNHLWKARTAEIMGLIHGMEYDSHNALQYNKEAAEEYGLAGRSRNKLFSLVDFSQQLNFLDQPKRSLQLLDSICKIASVSPKDSMLLDFLYGVKIRTCLESGYHKEAMVTRNAQKKLGYRNYVTFEDSINDLCLDINFEKYSEAVQTVEELLPYATDVVRRGAVFIELKELYYNTGKFKEASELADSVIDMQNRVMAEKLRQSIPTIQRDVYRMRSNKAEARNSILIKFLWIICIIGLLILIFIFMYHRFKIRLRMAELQVLLENLRTLEIHNSNIERERTVLENKLELTTNELNSRTKELQAVTSSLADSNTRVKDAKDEIGKLLREKWKPLNILCAQYYDLGYEDSLILKSLKREIDNLKSSNSIKSIEKVIDEHMDGIISMLRAECSFLTEKEVSIYILMVAGLSVKTVCLIFGLQRNHLYTVKSRMIEKINKASVEHKDLLINILKAKD